MSVLAEFQRAFAAVLLNPQTSTTSFNAGITVYKNTVIKGLIDALRANFPTVERLVGAEWFDSIAMQYAYAHLPTQPTLALYGESFPDFMEHHEAVHDLPYLPCVARLDRLWIEAHFAADAPCLSASMLTTIAPQALGELKLKLHAAARVARYAHSSVSIWRSNRPPAIPPQTLEVEGGDEAVLITRPQGAVEVWPLTPAGFAFVTQLREGVSLADAATYLLELDPQTDIAALLVILINAGAFANLEMPNQLH